MLDQFVALIIDESKWLTASMGFALLAVSALLYRHRKEQLPIQRRVYATMNLFFAVTIGTMAFGHLLAVTTKLAWGTLEGSLLRFYIIGILLAVPSWWLIFHALKLFSTPSGPARKTLLLNGWLAVTLLALGLPNLPLAAPGFFNIGYGLHSRPLVGWAMVSMAIVINLGLFIGSLIFLASGQSFEQFRGME